MNELIALASAIENGNAPLPPNLSRLIEAAPESFDDLRAGQVAVALRAMREGNELVNFASIGERKPKLIQFISVELLTTDLPLDVAEAEAEKCWHAYQVRRAKSIFAESSQALETTPDKASVILEAAQTALTNITSDTRNGLPDIVDAADFMAEEIDELVELICGMAHKGSKIALGGGSKSHKTWLLMDMGISVAYGADWLGRSTTQGKVLFVNFELQRKPTQKRLMDIAQAKGITWQNGLLDLWNLRGYSADFRKLIPKIIARARREGYALIILDPIYKLYGGTDENAAGDVAELLNEIERLAVETGAAVAFGAHFAKGNAGAKESIDRMSGSGVFARDPDSILTFTRHETEAAFVIESNLRNFAPVAPFAVRWQFPLMIPADDLDPSKLKQAGGRKPTHLPDDLLALLPSAGLANADWLAKADGEGISKATFYRLRKELKNAGKILESIASGTWQPILTK